MIEERTWWYHPHALRKGDAVVVVPDPHPILSQHERTGEQGVVVGFTDKSVCRWWEPHCGNKAGVYEDLEYPIVEFPNGERTYFRASLLEVLDDGTYESRVRELLGRYPANSIGPDKLGDYVAPLPEDGIWEGDVVRLKSGARKPERAKPGWVLDQRDSFLVSWLSFRVPGDVIESRERPPSFSLADRFKMNSEDGWSEDELELVKRGNFWREAHGEELFFPSSDERASFLCTTRRVEFVERPWTILYQAMTQVHQGKGHGVMRMRSFTGCGEDISYQVVKFEDRSFGRLISHRTLDHGFLIPTHEDE